MKQFSIFIILGVVSCFFFWSNNSITTEEYRMTSATDSLTAKIELGRYLFYDSILSRDSSISCASCHHQNKAFTDGEVKSIGFRGQIVSRNSPTLINVLNRKMFLLDGVNPSLESQVTVPIQEHKEFDFHILLIAERLKKNKKYVDLSLRGFGTLPNAQVITGSIAAFERTIITDNSPFDRFKNGDRKAISKSARKGAKLFFDKLYCGACHSAGDLTNDSIANNGLYEVYADKGRFRLTEKKSDIAVFKVPTLRNITMTAPYMHDGSISTLEEVLDHYQSGGKSHVNKSELIQPFKLSEKERIDLLNFFTSLTDSTVLTNPNLSSPF
jgi:cytochrome c peroxidase